ncbi:hypothetical protein JCM10212_000519 [Sporobolomyces blumeae]
MSSTSGTNSVSSRFVSSTDLEAAKAKREQEWREAYERIGEQPPERDDQAEQYDPRSLWEKLQENKTKKQEAFEEQLKFKNHFRALDEEEISFLDSMIDESNDEEKERQRAIKQELESFRKAVTARSQPPPPPALSPSSSSSTTALSPSGSAPVAKPSTSTTTSTATRTPATSTATATATATVKKGKKLKGLPGLVVKKKNLATSTSAASKPIAAPIPARNSSSSSSSTNQVVAEQEEPTRDGKERESDKEHGGVASTAKRRVDEAVLGQDGPDEKRTKSE